MSKGSTIAIVVILIAAGALIPTAYVFGTRQNQVSPMAGAALLLLQPPAATPPTISILVNGSAAGLTEVTLNLTTFQTESNLTIWTGLRKGSGWSAGGAYVGIPLKTIIYDLAGVTSYTNVTFRASDGYSKMINITWIENANLLEQAMVAYTLNGTYLSTSDGPARLIITQLFSWIAYSSIYNGPYCVSKLVNIQID